MPFSALQSTAGSQSASKPSSHSPSPPRRIPSTPRHSEFDSIAEFEPELLPLIGSILRIPLARECSSNRVSKSWRERKRPGVWQEPGPPQMTSVVRRPPNATRDRASSRSIEPASFADRIRALLSSRRPGVFHNRRHRCLFRCRLEIGCFGYAIRKFVSSVVLSSPP